MSRALIIGGTRFIGRHLVTELLESGYDVTLFNRGNHPNPFADDGRVSHVTGDRTSGAALDEAAQTVEPDIVIDCVAYYPGEVELATKAFSDADAYVFISSGSAYGPDRIPKREDETPLESCTAEQAVDDSPVSYGPRKAEGDRKVFEAAEHGVRAMSVRPTIVYGTHDYTGRLHYWVERVRNHDEILIPGDGTNIHHLVAVENVVSALRVVAEEGEAGEAYNVGDRSVLTLGTLVETIADVLDRDVDLVTAGPRELANHSNGALEPTDFPLYNPNPHILATAKLAALGWEPVDPRTALKTAAGWDGIPERNPGPSREETERVLSVLK